VGLKQPNAFGLHDMLGNVWEWCQDMFTWYKAGYQIDPLGESLGVARIFRGGSWETMAAHVRSAERNMSHQNYYHEPFVSVGFRLARSNE
jgi:formylglycine-generating enzyme required for sulfatase activity